MRFILQALLALLFFAAPSAAAADDSWSGVDRVVAFGDMHGDYDKFVQLLADAGLVDERLKWSGGKAHFVQLGDILDRGPDSRKIADLIMRLESEARRKGGQVHFVIGNHEAMNMTGDLRYVSEGEYAAFRTSRSAAERERAYKNYVAYLRKTVPADELPSFDAEFKAKWEAEHPLGFVELRRAWSPRGKYGRWLLQHHSVIRINDMLFVHGGIGRKFQDAERTWLNDAITDDLKSGDYNPDGIAMDPEGPLWYRGLAMNPEATEIDLVDHLLSQHDVQHIVIGHTPLTGAILPRFGDKVVMIDVGLSDYYGGRVAFLEATPEGLFAIHRGTRLALPADGGEARISYLRSAAALDPQPSPLESIIQSLETAE